MNDEEGYTDDLSDENENTEPEEDRTPRGLRKALDRTDAKAKQAAAEAAAAKRELAFVKAGVDTDSKLGKLFANGYDGEVTVEAIRAAYAEINPAPAAQVKVEPEVDVDDEVTPSVDERRIEAATKRLREIDQPYGLPSTPAIAVGLQARATSGQRDVGVREWLNTKIKTG